MVFAVLILLLSSSWMLCVPSVSAKIVARPSWIASLNIQAPKICLASSSQGLRGVFATEAIEAGEVVLEVPLEHCFTALSESASDGISEEDDLWPKRIAESISKELLKGKYSLHHSYFQDLPSPAAFRACMPHYWDTIAFQTFIDNEESEEEGECMMGLAYILDEIEKRKEWRASESDTSCDMVQYALDCVQTRNCALQVCKPLSICRYVEIWLPISLYRTVVIIQLYRYNATMPLSSLSTLKCNHSTRDLSQLLFAPILLAPPTVALASHIAMILISTPKHTYLSTPYAAVRRL